MRAGYRATGASVLVVIISISLLGQRSGDLQPGTSPRGIRPDVKLPPEAAGWEHVVEGLLSAFDKADVIALGASRGVRGSELRNRLIRHPDFPIKARFIVVEWGNSRYQSNLDRYIKGEDVPLEELQQVWRNQTQIASWDSPIYAGFFAVVREINQKLPSGRQLRVLGGDPPIDWSKIETITDYMSFAGGEHRDESLASVLRNQVIKNHEKALVIYGSAHFKVVEESAPGKVFVVNAQGGSGPRYEEFEKALHSRERPVLLSLRGTPAASFVANLLSWGARRFVGGKEVPLFAPGVTLGDLADACVYFGQVADADPEPDPAIYRGTPYGTEIARRRQILDTKR